MSSPTGLGGRSWAEFEFKHVLRHTLPVFNRVRLTPRMEVPTPPYFIHDALDIVVPHCWQHVDSTEMGDSVPLRPDLVKMLREARSSQAMTSAAFLFSANLFTEEKRETLAKSVFGQTTEVLNVSQFVKHYRPREAMRRFDVVACNIGQFFGLDADIVVLFTNKTPGYKVKIDSTDPDNITNCPNELYLGLSRAIQLLVLVSPPTVLSWLNEQEEIRPPVPLYFQKYSPGRKRRNPARKERSEKMTAFLDDFTVLWVFPKDRFVHKIDSDRRAENATRNCSK